MGSSRGRSLASGMRILSRSSDNARRLARLFACIVAVLGLAALSCAGEDSDVYGDLMRRYDAVNDELQKTLADLEYQTPLPDVPERVLSIRKNAIVTIGGEARFTYAFNKSTFHDPGFDPGNAVIREIDKKAGEFSMPTLKLLVDARIHNRWRVFLDMNVSNTRAMHKIRTIHNPNTPDTVNPAREYEIRNETDLINQAYVELMKGDHSGFGLLVGRMKLPFGLWDRPNLMAQGFLDAPNLSGSYLPGEAGRVDKALLPHASRFADPVDAVMVNYEMRDIVRFEGAVFQEKDARKITERRRDGSTSVRSEASVPQSWQIGASLMPLDGWELTAHFRNRHNRGRGIHDFANSPYRWDFRNYLVSGAGDPNWDVDRGQWSDTGAGESFGSTKNEQSLILGLAVEVPNTNLAVRAEYARGWNQGFNRHIKSENVNIGLSYKLAPKVTLHGQGEWLQVKDRSWMAPDGSGGWARDQRNNHLYRAMVGVEYEAFKGMTFEAGWQYEYWRMKSARGSDGLGPEKHTNKANMFYLGTRFVF